MSSDENEISGKSRSKLRVLDPINARITESGLKLYPRNPSDPEKKPFLYYPSVTYTRKQPPNTRVNMWAYGTNDIIKLLVSGGVPNWVFQPQYWNKLEEEIGHADDRFYKYRSPTKRLCELWQMKKRTNVLQFEIEKSIVEARQKQKNILRKVSRKAEEVTKRTENVLKRNAETRQKGVDAYFEKLEKRAKKNLPKAVQDHINKSIHKRKNNIGMLSERRKRVTFPNI